MSPARAFPRPEWDEAPQSTAFGRWMKRQLAAIDEAKGSRLDAAEVALPITDPSLTPQKGVDLVTAEEFEKLDESQAALFLAD
jgi:hypothetical protein